MSCLGGNFQVHEIGFRFMIDGTARHTCRGKKNFCSGLNFCNAVHCVVKAGNAFSDCAQTVPRLNRKARHNEKSSRNFFIKRENDFD